MKQIDYTLNQLVVSCESTRIENANPWSMFNAIYLFASVYHKGEKTKLHEAMCECRPVKEVTIKTLDEDKVAGKYYSHLVFTHMLNRTKLEDNQ